MTKGKQAVAKKTKKSGKGKWIFLLLLLFLVGLGGGGYYLGYDKMVFDYLKYPDLSFWSSDEPEEDSIEMRLVEDLSRSVIELETEVQTVDKSKSESEKKRAKNYYVKVEECIDITCRQEVIRFLRQEKLSFIERKENRKARYHELVSTTAFPRKVALGKLELLRQQPAITGGPYLVKEHNLYKISLGLFPREDTGVRLKAELVYLYPKLKIDFDLRPKNTYYSVNSILAGPYKKAAAESVLKRLQENPGYESSEMISRL